MEVRLDSITDLAYWPTHTRPSLLLTLRSQFSEAATEGEIFGYVAHSFKAFEQASHAIAREQSSKTPVNLRESERGGVSDRIRPSQRALLPREISKAVGLLLDDGRFPDFEPLEGAVNGVDKVLILKVQ